MRSGFEMMHLYITEQSNYQPHCQRSIWSSEKCDEVGFPSLKLPSNSSVLSKCQWLLFNLFRTGRSKWVCVVKWNSGKFIFPQVECFAGSLKKL